MKLLLTTACDRVVEDRDYGTTLVSLFHEIKIQVSHNAEIPRDAVIPRDWFVFSKFELETDEEEKEYALDLQVFWPDGKLFAKITLPASHPTKNGMAFKTRFTALPMGQNGDLKIVQSLTSEGETKCGPIEMKVRVIVEKGLS